MGTALGAAESAASERDAAHRLADLIALCFSAPAVRGIIWHGMDGLLRPDFSPKPAYHFLNKLIHIHWHTRAIGVTDAAGLFRFRGFFGTYRVAVQIGDEPAAISQLALRSGPEICLLGEPPGGSS